MSRRSRNCGRPERTVVSLYRGRFTRQLGVWEMPRVGLVVSYLTLSRGGILKDPKIALMSSIRAVRLNGS